MKRWMAFFVGTGFLLASQAHAATCQLKKYGTIPAEMLGSKPTTMVKINGADTRFIIDTGAFFNMMSNANASSLGLRLTPAPFGFHVSGVGGSASVKFTRVKEFGILDTTLKNIDFMVGGTDTTYGLLGANLLDVVDLEIDLANGKLTLFDAGDCGDSPLAYWTKERDYFVADLAPPVTKTDRRTILYVTINGKRVRAVLDSGAAATVISRDAAERAGIDLNGPDAKPTPGSIGIGAKVLKGWIVHVDSFSVGTETIQHSQMQVVDGKFGQEDMLLGVDFLLAHRMFIANSHGKAYFTYNGGRVFSFANAGSGDSLAAATSAATDDTAAPKTANDYLLLGEAHFSRGETDAGIAALNQAIGMAPDQANYYLARARAYAAMRKPDAVLVDLDKTLALDPKNVDALVMRAELRFVRKDRTGAAADTATAAALAPVGSTQARSIASLYLRLDQPASALPILDAWIPLHDNDVHLGIALNERCWALGLTNQRLDDALKDCNKAIKRDGDHPGYLGSLGLVQLRLGHYPESMQAYQQAVANGPRLVWARYGLGLVKIRSGQADAGHADLVAARALAPDIDERAAKFGLAASAP